MPEFLLSIDQGTTSTRAIIFSRQGVVLSSHQLPIKSFFPQDGWVEQDAEEIWMTTLECLRQALANAHLSARDIASIGISNQRETTILWHRHTGKIIYPAIVWQDRRTAEICRELQQHPVSAHLVEKTGLLLDPYFSATKIMWILRHVPHAREMAERGELAFGTVDCFLLWRLTNGAVHATDATNASRTLLFNIVTQQWDDDILRALEIPAIILPSVLDSSADFGKTAANLLGDEIHIGGIAGDQQAACVGQACFQPGMMKTTYGTGSFMLLNTGDKIIHSKNRLLSTVAYRLEKKVTYGIEGSIFCAGATIKWLRDQLKLIETAADSDRLAESVADTGGVYLVPAFTGLGAPYWNPHARGAISGLTLNSTTAHIARAALEAICYQTRDLLIAILQDGAADLKTLRVDGGAAASNWLLQFLANILDLSVERPRCVETSALGAAFLAGLQVGMYQSLDEIADLWQKDAEFQPVMTQAVRGDLYDGWLRAVSRALQ